MGEKKSRGSGRTRSWTFIVYPESAPENWREILDEKHIQWIESPLHDNDLNADRTAKKPHWHILLMYESVKAFEQVRQLTDCLNSPIPQKCAGAKALVRYMAHLDNPDKAQYSVNEIVGHGGADVAELLKPSSSERYSLIREMLSFVRDARISEFQDLVDYAMEHKFDDWFPLLCDNSSFIVMNYIKSYRNRSLHKVDLSTGEIKE